MYYSHASHEVRLSERCAHVTFCVTTQHRLVEQMVIGSMYVGVQISVCLTDADSHFPERLTTDGRLLSFCVQI
ncbi:hypothetical protein CEXT_486491 [Caerostris extrusa]|uniref:Uncharacterized protein n=1 Tax=Caerostris extrusa TaxID=172846 RepID=A0AAV4SX75_CAEEX|nr:hypothetical protein CEXT_486491 [Caerostris extrusa]